MRVIYDRPGEYADLGLNPYAGCSHRCQYCYNQRVDRQQDLPYDKPAKNASLRNIEHDLQILQSAHDKRPVHISFVGDPYDMGRKGDDKPTGLFQYLSEDELKANPRATDNYVRTVLKMFRAYGQPFQILTKGGMIFGLTVVMLGCATFMIWCIRAAGLSPRNGNSPLSM